MEVALPPGEREVVETLRLGHKVDFMTALGSDSTGFRSRLCIKLSGGGLVKTGITLHGRYINGLLDSYESNPAWATASIDGVPMQPVAVSRLAYRDVLALHGETDTDRLLEVAFTPWMTELLERIDPGSVAIDTLELRVRVERLAPRCVMAANLSGDISGNFFGDVAYFNARKEAVQEGMMAGTLADDGMHAQMEGFVGMIGAFAAMAEQQGRDSGLTPEQKLQLGIDEDGNPLEVDHAEGRVPTPAQRATAEGLEEMLRPAPGEPGDNFGLSLTDVRQRGASPVEEVAPGRAMRDAFTLTLSGAIQEMPGEGEEGAREIAVAVSSLTMTAGMSDRRGAIKFELDEDAGFDFVVHPVNADMLWGTLATELVTKSVYSESSDGVVNSGTTGGGLVSSETPRKLRVNVDARFFAGRGVLSCMGR